MKRIVSVLLSVLLIISLLCGCTIEISFGDSKKIDNTAVEENFSLDNIPEYSGNPYISINNGQPFFTEEEINSKLTEKYSPLDKLGRCGVCIAKVCKDTMPTEDRGSISEVKPSGWVQAEYDCVSGKSLYNRCHLIGFQLTGENANERNLITGTRALNIDGMLPFENMVADYVKEEKDAHVLYRVTPIYTGNNLVANGVLMEGYSVEDRGESIQFCVYCYNNQPEVIIDYATGESHYSQGYGIADSNTSESSAKQSYVLNTNSKKFHLPSCGSVDEISSKNKKTVTATRDSLISEGYSPCHSCNP